MGEVLLTLDNVNLKFGAHHVLRDVCAEVHKNESPHGKVICFLGPSGMGKTQLSKIIAGLQTPTSGEVTLQDGKRAARGKACMVPQNYPMFEYTTVAGNLEIAGQQAHYSHAEINTKASELIETFGLVEHLAKYPRELSGGTRQRVAIARQLMCPSKYVVMDEPFSGLDPISKASAMGAITKLADRDVYQTIILVTHDVTSGLCVADTVWMLGLERNEDGTCLAGARLVATYDLAQLGFAWREDLEQDPKFLTFAREVKNRFNTLGGPIGR